MPTLSFQKLWDAHPGGEVYPCDESLFRNQCAIRMGIALSGAGVDLRNFGGARCYPGLKHQPKHTLRAQDDAGR